MKLFEDQKKATGTYPYIIPVGGSMPLGVLGYINAVFELKQQLDEGVLSEPKVIFVAAGSGGTAAGLLLGLKAIGLKSKLVAIHIEPEATTNEMRTMILNLCAETTALYTKVDPSFIEADASQLEVLTQFGGTGYGEPLKEAIELAEQLSQDEWINLDPTYTSKALYGMDWYIKKHGLQKKPVLFWHTFSGDSFEELLEKADATKVPGELQHHVAL